jgi:hypothetical protein
VTLTIDLTESAILTVLRAFLIDVLPLAPESIVQGQDNRVSEPMAGDFIVFWPLNRMRLSTNRETWDVLNPAPSAMDRMQPTQVLVQLDVHGPNSTDNCQIITTTFRSDYATTFFAASGKEIQPLYADDGHQMPFINGEQQYEDRWVIQAVLQANPIVSTPQQFADTLTVDLVEVDTTYPPGA